MIKSICLFILLGFLYTLALCQTPLNAIKKNSCTLKNEIRFSNTNYAVDYLFSIKGIQSSFKKNTVKKTRVFSNGLTYDLTEESYLLNNIPISISRKAGKLSDILYIKTESSKTYLQFRSYFELIFLGYNVKKNCTQLYFKLKSTKCNLIISVLKWHSSKVTYLTQFDNE